MDYETFKEVIKEDIKQNLEENGFKDIEMAFHNIEKTNQSYESLTVYEGNNNIGVNFNIEKAFSDYEKTEDYNGVAFVATNTIMNALESTPAVDMTELMDYDAMKEKLSIEVISAEMNEGLLDRVPHEMMEDMAVVYRFVLESNEESRSSILVTNNIIDKLGVTPEQLKMDAMEIAPEHRPAVIQGMNELMIQLMGEEVFESFGIPPMEEQMYVASVQERNSGAGVIAYQNFMEEAAEKLGGDFYIIPSSIHEVMLVPDDGVMNADSLTDMVKDVNDTQLSPEEKLSDNVYHYDAKDHVFELAEKFEARQQEKALTEENSREHGSVLKELKDKQKEITEKAAGKDAVHKGTKAKSKDEIAV